MIFINYYFLLSVSVYTKRCSHVYQLLESNSEFIGQFIDDAFSSTGYKIPIGANAGTSDISTALCT